MNILFNNEYEILTPSGFESFSAIRKQTKSCVKLYFSDNSNFICSLKHVFVENDKNIEASSLKIEDVLFNRKIINLEFIDDNEVFDLLDVKGSLYYTSCLTSHNCEFLGASGAIIKSEVLKNIPVQNPILTQYDEKFRVFREPNKDHQYIAICDVSEGIEKDSSTIQVIDLTNFPYEQVAVFQDNTMKSNLFHLTIDKICKNYNNALCIVESNSIGKEVLNNLFYDVEYENLFSDDDFGIRTTKTIKNIGCSELKYLIENSYLTLKDYETIAELSNFIRHSDGKIGAKKDHHDDLVMPLVLFSYFVNNKKLFGRYFDNIENGKINNIVIQKIDNELLPIGWVNDGHGIQNLVEVEEDIFGIYIS